MGLLSIGKLVRGALRDGSGGHYMISCCSPYVHVHFFFAAALASFASRFSSSLTNLACTQANCQRPMTKASNRQVK